jgi:hypothetical protein
MTFSVAGMATAAGSGHKQRSKACGRREHLIVEGRVAAQETQVFGFGQPFHRAIEEGVIVGSRGKYFVACNRCGRYKERRAAGTKGKIPHVFIYF